MRPVPRIDVICKRCGSPFSVTESRLRAGRGRYCSKSCSVSAQMTKHGHSGKSWQSPTYNTWATMIQRCTNPAHPKFPAYGGGGVTVCEDWLDFSRFLADMGEKPEGTSLDRRDGAKGYEPGNCRWATPAEQMKNIRTNKRVLYGGELVLLIDLAAKLGVNKATLRHRIKNGWPEEIWGAQPHVMYSGQQRRRGKGLSRRYGG